ncbi:MAG: DUF480 domain-containing protein [Thiogranum sp.]|nr:DUF480 domain-containing protein [Thiogranum sp.]
MDIRLTPNEARVIGCLIEKQHTTPEHYPLSLNALTNACNQKSSRDPVMELDEATVQDTIDALIKKRQVIEKSGFGSRVTKYQHRFCNTEFGTLKFSDQELGIVCVLLLRGPQTPGELRTRTDRLCKFQDIHEVEATLDQLMQRHDGAFVAKLPREPGKRETRFAHLFGGEITTPYATAPVHTAPAAAGTNTDRLAELEETVKQLREEMERITARLDRISPDEDAASMP